MGWRCDTCGRSFGSTRALRQHMSALGHVESPFQFKCHRCPTMFRTSSDADDHMCLYNHWSQQCSRCPASTPTEDQLKQHEIECHFWCSKCEREFQSYNNIKMHMNSRVHLGTSITCPCCTSSFTTATGLAHHLETGSCPKATGLNRDVVYNLIRSVDHNGLIAKNLIGWHGSTTYEASERANKLYHCLNRGGCGKEFTTLAGVCNHLESETCGVISFQTVQRHFQGMLRGDKLIAFH
ncbi:hypothetical protein F5B17DRAFT_443299 [Nemania serpens]|nr:hypothetical protein F5B17DRAFT_443299 [Nemania serpens]